MIPKLYIKHYALGIVLLAVLFGCTTEAERRQMRAGLDSINVLNRTDQPFTPDDVRPYVDFFDKEAKAFFTLLPSDSIHNDQLLAHYLLGRAYHEKGDAPMALESYQHAIDHADTTSAYCDYRQLSRVYAQMANLFYQQGLYEQQLTTNKLSVKYAWFGKDTLAALMSYEQQSYAYEELGYQDSAIYVIENVSKFYTKYGYTTQAAISLGALLRVYINKGDYVKAKSCFEQYEKESGFFSSSGDIDHGREIYYKIKGLYYLHTNHLDSAKYFFQKELFTGYDFINQHAAATGLTLLYQRQHRTDSVAKYAWYAYAMNDSLYAHKTVKDVERIRAMYDYSRHQEIAKRESERASIEHSKRQFIFMLLLLVASIAAIVIYKMYIDRKKKQVLYLKTLEQLEQTQADILCLRSHAEENEELISEKEHQLERLNTIMQEYRKNAQHNNAIIDKRIKDTDIYQTLLQKQHGQKLTHDELRECRRLVLENLPNINNLLLSKEYKLNDKDYNVCILFRLGFKSKEVSNMLDVSQGRVSQISSKMLQVLFHESTGGASELIEKLYDI